MPCQSFTLSPLQPQPPHPVPCCKSTTCGGRIDQSSSVSSSSVSLCAPLWEGGVSIVTIGLAYCGCGVVVGLRRMLMLTPHSFLSPGSLFSWFLIEAGVFCVLEHDQIKKRNVQKEHKDSCNIGHVWSPVTTFNELKTPHFCSAKRLYKEKVFSHSQKSMGGIKVSLC